MTPENKQKFKALCRQAAADSCVLLRNYNGFLPLKSDTPVAFFGRAAYEYTVMGTGSGGLAFTEYVSTIFDGFSEHGYTSFDRHIASLYRDFIRANPYDTGEEGKFASEPRVQKEYEIPYSEIKKAASANSKAIIFLSRRAGEEKEVLDSPGSFRLNSAEKRLIAQVTREFQHVGIVFNTSHIMDMAWISAPFCHDRIDAVLLNLCGGIEGGNGLSDVLMGHVSPSGHLSDTIAAKISDYPSDKNFGDENDNFYEEDIYVGYRYFETFDKESVLYPFGFGLSYTDFVVTGAKADFREILNMTTFDNTDIEITVAANIKNVGTFPGRAVLQVYYSAPNGALGRPTAELCAFGKTGILSPNETAPLYIKFKLSSMASFDDTGATGHRSCRVLEKGTYKIYYGFDVRSLTEVAEITRDTTWIAEKLSDALAPKEEFMRIKRGINGVLYEAVKPQGRGAVLSESSNKYNNIQTDKSVTGTAAACTSANAINLNAAQVSAVGINAAGANKSVFAGNKPVFAGKQGYSFDDVLNKHISPDDFANSLSDSALAALVIGEGFDNPAATPGSASVFGGITEELRGYGIPVLCTADGPSGIHLKKGMTATVIPEAMALSCTWDTELVKELYSYIALELIDYNVDILLGPGINIHRHPLCGRNFEYYSEDPVLAGQMAAAAVLGLHKNGRAGVIKHCLANSQETGRFTENNIISERAIRDIYLKPFEIAVRTGNANAIMTSYNMVNGHHSASNFDLTSRIIRDEWGFKGMIMTDWWPRIGTERGIHSATAFSDMVIAGNDIYMVVQNGTAESCDGHKDIMNALESGKLTRDRLTLAASNVLSFIIQILHNKKRYADAEKERQEAEASDQPEAEAFDQPEDMH